MNIFIDNINREATDDEQQEIIAAQLLYAETEAAKTKALKAKAAALKTVLDKLGLTADEAAILFG